MLCVSFIYGRELRGGIDKGDVIQFVLLKKGVDGLDVALGEFEFVIGDDLPDIPLGDVVQCLFQFLVPFVGIFVNLLFLKIAGSGVEREGASFSSRV